MVRIEGQINSRHLHRIVEYANGNVRRIPGHASIQSTYDSLFSRTTIKIDDLSHFTVRNYSGLEFGKQNTVDRLTRTRGGHTNPICEFEYAHQENNPNYRYAVIAHVPKSPVRLVGYMWGEDLHGFDLLIAHVLNPSDSELSAKVEETGMGMDESVKAFLTAEQAKAKIHGKHPVGP